MNYVTVAWCFFFFFWWVGDNVFNKIELKMSRVLLLLDSRALYKISCGPQWEWILTTVLIHVYMSKKIENKNFQAANLMRIRESICINDSCSFHLLKNPLTSNHIVIVMVAVKFDSCKWKWIATHDSQMHAHTFAHVYKGLHCYQRLLHCVVQWISLQFSTCISN